MQTNDQMAKRPTVTVVEIVVFIAISVFQFRLLGVTILCLLALLYAFYPFYRQRWCLITAGIAFAVSLLLPFDVALGSYYPGSRRGIGTSGPHFVRFVDGMPRHTYLIQTYGEYMGGGCSWPGVFPPRWILVWS